MAAVKTIGSSGQIALGKEYAGRQALVEEIGPGTWVVRLGHVIPDSDAMGSGLLRPGLALGCHRGAERSRRWGNSTLRIARGFRAVALRDGEWLRLLTLHPDHDYACAGRPGIPAR